MDVNPLDVLKWVGLVFGAGFIGYFGRYLSMLLIDKLRKKKNSTQNSGADPGKETATVQDSRLEESLVKLEKKKAKAEIKKAKKEKN